MGLGAGELYHRSNRGLHRAPSGLKMLAVLAVVAFALATPAVWAWILALPALLLILAALASGMSMRIMLRRLLFAEPVILGVAALSLLQPEGWRIFLLLVARSSLCMLAMLVLAGTTPFYAIVTVLRRLRVPALLITTLWLMHRYLAVMLEESQRMRRARGCRTFTPGRRQAWRILATVAGQLFIRSSHRAERVYAAMCARGWRDDAPNGGGGA